MKLQTIMVDSMLKTVIPKIIPAIVRAPENVSISRIGLSRDFIKGLYDSQFFEIFRKSK